MRGAADPEPPVVTPLTSWWMVPSEQFGDEAQRQARLIRPRTPKRERESSWGDDLARLTILEREQKRGARW